MAYNKTVSITIGFKTPDLELAIIPCQGKVAEVVDKACDYCYYLSLETLSYQSLSSLLSYKVGMLKTFKACL